ncbi:hypothetical protein GCM10010266_59060 [Streptomyces griseomycini]|uniref:hypothetical protein n=1 Tax=Streptomyces griseomycini TaxID=66895 RepID=UPI00198B9FAA|nr:hypothetical protein [Streptomyces griseomycini]GGQ27965.1 hypothetical protein GCM10010266_59060 [Streptomyces griseomycini]
MGAAVVEPAVAERSRHVKRAVRAAGAGLVAVAGSTLMTRLLLDSSACQDAPGYGCLGYALLWSYLLPVLNFLLTWPALRVLAVRPSWPTALLGTGIGWYLVHGIDAARWLPGDTQYVQAALYTGAFLLASWFTQSRRPLWPRAAVALVLVLLMPLDSLAATQLTRSRQNHELADAGVPLLGPRLPAGYHLDGVGTTGSAATREVTFHYRISPDSLGKGANTMDELRQEIQVTVGPVQPGFTPPSHCAALTNVHPVPSPACSPVAPGVWRWSNYDHVKYFTRVGDAVAVLQARTPPVSSAVLRELAGTMRVRPPSYFTGG